MHPKVITIALDITDIIAASLAMPGMLVLYQYYPLRDMLYDILSPTENPGEIENFYEKLYSLVPCTIHQSENNIHIFIERVCFDTDELVQATIGNIYASYTYSMTDWLDSSSIMLQVKETDDTNFIPSGFEFGK